MDILLFCSIVILCGFLGGRFSNWIKLPGVVGYLLVGVVLGPSVFNFAKEGFLNTVTGFNDLALSIVAFIIGSQLRMSMLKRMGKGIISVILSESLAAFLIVFLGIYLLSGNLPMALLFGAMAPASAPAGTAVVLREYKAKGPLTNALYAVVGLDDGLAIIIYSFSAAFAKLYLVGSQISLFTIVRGPVLEIIGSIGLGSILALGFGYFMRKINSNREILAVSLSAIFLCAGLSNHFHFSLILSNLTFGMVFANTFMFTSRRIVNTVDQITVPIYIIFFVIAGAHLQVKHLLGLGLLGTVYIICRTSGLIGGSYLGAAIARLSPTVRKYLGLGILSQAGVAIGLALLVTNEFSVLGAEGSKIAIMIINTIAATTIVFEIIGPIATKIAISKAGEIGK